MSISAIETVRGQLRTELLTINGTGVFRNTIKHVMEDLPNAYPECPSLIVLFLPTWKIVPDDQIESVFNIIVPFSITGLVHSNTSQADTSELVAAQDSLWHDIMQALAPLYTKYLSDSYTTRWNIMKDLSMVPIYPDNENNAGFIIQGVLNIRFLSTTFV